MDLLSEELKLNILSYCDGVDLCRVSTLGTDWRRIAFDNRLWYRLASKAWNVPPSFPCYSWNKCYAERVLLQKDWKQKTTSSVRLADHKRTVTTFDSNKTHIISASADGTLKLWRIPEEEEQQQHQQQQNRLRPCISYLGHKRKVSSVQMDQLMNLVVSGSFDHSFNLYDLTTGTCIYNNSAAHQSYIVCVNFSQNYLVTSSWDTTVKMWDLRSPEKHVWAGKHDSYVNSVRLIDNSRAISCSDDQTLRVWDFAATTPNTTRSSTSTNASFDSEKKYSQPIMCMVHKEGVTCFDIDPLRRFVVSGSNDRTAIVWDLLTGESKRILSSHSKQINQVRLHPDSRIAVTCSLDGTAKVWGLENGNCLQTLQGSSSIATQLTIDVDSTKVITGSNYIKVWDICTGECIQTWNSHTDVITKVKIQDELMISSSFDCSLRIWQKHAQERNQNQDEPTRKSKPTTGRPTTQQ